MRKHIHVLIAALVLVVGCPVPNRPPVLDPIGNRQVSEGEFLEFFVTASDPDGDTLTYDAANLPAGAVFDAVLQTFSWTPGLGTSGNYPDVLFRVTDDGTPRQSDSESITITTVGASPPFDASGTYTGNWTATTGLELTCSFLLTIEQSPYLPFPGNFSLLGSARFNYDCILDQALLDLVGLGSTSLTAPLVGTMSQDQAGNITLSVNTEGLDWPFVFELTFDGAGQDTSGDGGMDGYSGAYSLSLSWQTEFEGYEDVRVASGGAFDASIP